MKRWMNYLVIESQEDFDAHYDKSWNRLERNSINKIPTKFPICYRLCESWDAHFCDSWVECDIKNALEVWKKCIEEEQKFVEVVEEIFNPSKGRGN